MPITQGKADRVPAKAAILSRTGPPELPGNFPGCLSVRVPCRSFAAALSTGSMARRMDSISVVNHCYAAGARYFFSALKPGKARGLQRG
jgi:hypothetical protein